MDETSRSKGGFKSIKTADELRTNLINKAQTLHNTRGAGTNYLCHYTSLSAALAIIDSGYWYIGSPKNMNDGLEISHGDTDSWDKIFFASFMCEPTESIAMWSMYAQPWDKGVMIRIPVELIKKWLKESPAISSADSSSKKVNDDDIANNVVLSLHAVAYTNEESHEEAEPIWVKCGNEENNKLSGITSSKSLVGYIKDSAWSYENEYRVRAETTVGGKYSAIAIKLSDEIISSIEIIAGPRFAGTVDDYIPNKLKGRIDKDHFGKSIFSDKLKWVYCDQCKTNDAREKIIRRNR